jgi:RNA polymerase sigma factor (sigma-70 family)
MGRAKTINSSAVARLAALAFQKYAPQLRRYVVRRLRKPDEAPDLTQEIFERFMRVDRADAIQNPQGYLFKIASHVISETLCREEQSLVTYDSELVQKAVDEFDSASPEVLADRLGLQRDIRNALKALPDNHLAALLLVKGEGLSYEEAAREAGFTENTIGTYVKHGRAKLRLMLEDYESGKGSPK